VGVFEEAKGKVKSAVGDVADKPELQAEGEAQAEKGAEQRQETKERAAAEAHEAKADLYEQKQRAAEG
jgi:uncharacterized protein YjbJ (UPF0337 family)